LYKSFFISKDGVPVNIPSGNDLFSYFGKHNKELREYLREQKITFKKNPEKALIAAVRYADKNSWHGQ
jgi:biotin synthase-related radical SAM superfamily protein